MSTANIGLPQRLANYVAQAGNAAEPNHFALGYSQAGRFGVSSPERDPTWSAEQRSAYNQGMDGRQADNAAGVEV